jgi:hypothetical protein
MNTMRGLFRWAADAGARQGRSDSWRQIPTEAQKRRLSCMDGGRRINLSKTTFGLVSRVTPVQTALRNCTRDEGGLFEFDNQVLISSHRKLLWSKDTMGWRRDSLSIVASINGSLTEASYAESFVIYGRWRVMRG